MLQGARQKEQGEGLALLCTVVFWTAAAAPVPDTRRPNDRSSSYMQLKIISHKMLSQ